MHTTLRNVIGPTKPREMLHILERHLVVFYSEVTISIYRILCNGGLSPHTETRF